ncbi:MAG: cellulase family glycosylhydrolase [Spirochaetales bacterium]|nr:cellulase family glycosylhydrolase [Spirochaetales bacterium]
MNKLKINVLFILILFAVTAPLYAQPAGVVYSNGTHFYVDGGIYYFAGANCYDLFTCEPAVLDTRFAEMASDGIKVVRTWGWSNEDWHGFEKQPGVYDENQFMLFDYIMEAARKNGIRIVIVFTGYWEAYGGIDQSLKWQGLPSGDHASRSVYFKNAGCKQHFKNYAAHFINRINSISGMPYKEDPVLFAWQLMNEPRYQNATPNEDATGETFRAWIDEMAGYIKSLDSNHMVSLGIEGHESRYGFGGNEGNPFIYSHQSPYIDYTTAHPYPTEEWADLTLGETENLVRAWISDAHNEVGKPFVMDEFNVHSSKVNRSEWWNALFNVLEDNDAAGSCFWTYNGRNIDSTFGASHGAPELSVLKAHSVVMSSKSRGGPPPKDTPGFSFGDGDFRTTGYLEQDDGIHVYYYIYCENTSNQGYQGNMKIRIYITEEVTATIERHYESSDEYMGDPVVSGWIIEGEYKYYEVDFGNRALTPGERIGFKGGMAASSGGIDISNDWSLSDITTSSSELERVVIYLGDRICTGESPSGGTVTTAPTSAPTATPIPTTAPTITPTGVTTLLGDVNNNGSVDIVDALLVAQYYVSLNPSPFNLSAADTNCDGTVNIVDALLIAQYYVGLSTGFCL